MKFIGQMFRDQTVDLDFQEFVDCRFDRCKLIYRGFGPVQLDRCKFGAVEWTFSDAAQNTVNFLSGLYHGAGLGGQQLVDQTFHNIQSGSLQRSQTERNDK